MPSLLRHSTWSQSYKAFLLQVYSLFWKLGHFIIVSTLIRSKNGLAYKSRVIDSRYYLQNGLQDPTLSNFFSFNFVDIDVSSVVMLIIFAKFALKTVYRFVSTGLYYKTFYFRNYFRAMGSQSVCNCHSLPIIFTSNIYKQGLSLPEPIWTPLGESTLVSRGNTT